MENPDFLKNKYWNKDEFKEAVGRTKIGKKGEKIRKENDEESLADKKRQRALELSNPEDISDYLERIKNVAENKGELFRKISLYPKFIIKPENISDEYLKNILLGNFAEMKGYDRDKLANREIKEQILKMFKEETGEDFEKYQVPEEEKEKIIEQTIKDQKASLDRWFEYLTGPEARNYPDEFRYWSFAEVLKLGAQDRDKKGFNKRTENTAAPFPELNQQALALALDEMRRKYSGEPSSVKLDEESKQKDFKKRLKKENFGKLYGWALDYVNSLKLPEERLPITEGEWKTFSKGSSAKELSESLQGFNTGWCIAGEGTAESYLDHSDVLVYFSEDQEGNNTIPRAAIVSDGERVSEVRGIIQTGEVKQHLDDYITPLVKEKVRELPGGESWQEEMDDMKKLAEIHFKHIQGETFSRQDLIFLYEIDKPIRSTGYGEDPRIDEIRKKRNALEDATIVFECEQRQIAKNPEEINENTKAYVGELKENIFELVQKYDIDYIYTSFPEGRIEKFGTELGGRVKTEIANELEKRENMEGDEKMYISSYAKGMLEKPDFSTLENKEQFQFVKVKVRDLGFPSGATVQKIYEKAEKLGLELCPPEIGPIIRLDYEKIFKREQPKGEYFFIAMKQIPDSGGVPRVFYVSRHGVGVSWLYDRLAEPGSLWSADDGVVFRLRKTET